MALRGRRKDPEQRKSVRISCYITPELESRLLNDQDHIFSRFGSVNEWINALMDAYLTKRERGGNAQR